MTDKYLLESGSDGYLLESGSGVLLLEGTDITNSDNAYSFGVLAENSETPTGLTQFTVTNASPFAVNITIGATDMTGGTTWTLSDTATPDVNTYGLKAGLNGGDYTIVVKKSAPFNTLKAGLAASGTQQWGLKLYAPSGITDGATKTAVVTLYAAAA